MTNYPVTPFRNNNLLDSTRSLSDCRLSAIIDFDFVLLLSLIIFQVLGRF